MRPTPFRGWVWARLFATEISKRAKEIEIATSSIPDDR
jgi:hypothetical protein